MAWSLSTYSAVAMSAGSGSNGSPRNVWSVPLTMTLKISLANTEDGHWIAVMLEPVRARQRPEVAQAQQPGFDPFTVEAGPADVRVLGTQFVVSTWGERAEDPRDTLDVEIYEHWLEPAPDAA